MDHSYSKQEQVKYERPDRMPGMFGTHDHAYSNMSFNSPEKQTYKRERSTPTGKTPKQPFKFGSGVLSSDHKRHIPWTEAEIESFNEYVSQTPRRGETLTEYWQKCSLAMNQKFPSGKRNGLSCKGLSRRLFVTPSTDDTTSSVASLNDTTIAADNHLATTKDASLARTCHTQDVGTQTALSLPINTERQDIKDGDWVFMEPRKELQPESSVGAGYIHQTALKRLRRYPCTSDTEKANLIDALCYDTPQQFARALMTSSLAEDIKTVLMFDIEMDARECSSKHSVLSHGDFTDLTEFEWSNVIHELVTRQSTLAEVLVAVALPTERIGKTGPTEALCPVLATIYGMLMMQRYHSLSAVQKFVTVSLANEQTHQKVYDCLQKVGVSLSHNGMLQCMTSISGCFNSELIDNVKQGKRFRIVGDNINFHVGISQARGSVGKSGHMEHWFGSAAIFQNVEFPTLSTIAPQHDLRQVPYDSFILSQSDLKEEVNHMSNLVAQILVEHLPWLQFAKGAMNEEVDKVPGMNVKNKVIPLPILHKNEQKYADVVVILDTYQELCDSTFKQAEAVPQKVHIGGDQLTRERFSGARRLRAAALTESERLEGLNPISFELFHLQMTVLSVFFHILYSTQHTESFTLHSQKVRLLRKEADGNDVKNHYNSCKDLAESVIKAYVVEAACEHFGLSNTDTVPDNIPEYAQMSSEEIKSWLLYQIIPIVQKVTQSTRTFLNGTFMCVEQENTDAVNSYGNIVIEIGLIFLELCNIVKNPNRDRLLLVMKYLMMMLKGHNNRSKYALEILRLLCHQFALLSERTAHETIYGLFVNTGKTIIPADLQMEYLVRLTKGHLRSMCSNVTEQSLVRRSSAFFGMNQIAEHFDEETSTIKRSQKHKKLSAFEDEKKIILSLRATRPFLETPGRKVTSMKKAPRNPITKLNLTDFIQWIEYHKVNLFYEL